MGDGSGEVCCADRKGDADGMFQGGGRGGGKADRIEVREKTTVTGGVGLGSCVLRSRVRIDRFIVAPVCRLLRRRRIVGLAVRILVIERGAI